MSDIGDTENGIKSDVRIELTVSFHPSYQVPAIYFKYYKHDYKHDYKMIKGMNNNEQEIEEDLEDLENYEDWELSFNLEFFYKNVIFSSKFKSKEKLVNDKSNNDDMNESLNITSIDSIDDDDEIIKEVQGIDDRDTSILSVSSITISEHHLNLGPWFFVHPCNTREFVDEITNNKYQNSYNNNYNDDNNNSYLFKEWFCKWWDFYGSIIV